jgi:hypothetical protein
VMTVVTVQGRPLAYQVCHIIVDFSKIIVFASPVCPSFSPPIFSKQTENL